MLKMALRTREFVSKLSRAGLSRLNFGIESGSNRILKKMRNMFNIEEAKEVLYRLNEHNVGFSVNIIVGFPGETLEDIEESRLFAEEMIALTDWVHINPCMVLDGSDLQRMPEKFDILTS
jgi:anaerobic magnesium-protoporphyrin IX monomethyl ester cyclase